jgi:hypothetical protein
VKDWQRPPVLAHRRFDADRQSFQNLSLRDRFIRIHATNLWGAESSVSGLGSERTAAAALSETFPALLHSLAVQRLLDAPCGDAQWITDLALPCHYIGIDIVPEIIAQLQSRHSSARQFLVADITSTSLPDADAILCRDCLVHLSYSNISRAIENFCRSNARYLLTTTFTQWEENHDIEDGDWRPLNFQGRPFEWPEPAAILNEGCTEADGAYADKCIGVWLLDDIRQVPLRRR